MTSITRNIVAYERDGDKFVAVSKLSDSQFAELRQKLRLPEDDPLYDSYPVDADVLAQIGVKFRKPLPSCGCEFFLETEDAAPRPKL